MNKKDLTVIFDIEWFEQTHLFKDVGMIPIYLSRLFNFESKIVYFASKENKDIITNDNINLISLKYTNSRISRYFRMLTYLIRESKHIDILMLYHLKPLNIIYMGLYKSLNKKGVLYLKLDIDKTTINLFLKYKSKLIIDKSFLSLSGINNHINHMIGKCKLFIIKQMLKTSSFSSVETKFGYDKFKEIYGEDIIKKLVLVPNGFSYESEKLIERKKYFEKEDIILTVGRIGSFQKNNEMLLDVVSRIDLKNWKVLFIGKYEVEFKKKIESLFIERPDLINKINLIGEIKSKADLYNYYNNAKVFCLTSRWEGFPLVFPEAIYFGNYVVSTDVGAEFDITNGGELGSIIKQNDRIELEKAILKIVNSEINLENYNQKIVEFCEKNFMWEIIVKEIYRNIMLALN